MPHYVKPTIYDGGIRLEFTCTEEPGADCKIACPTDPKDPYGCETFSLERDADGTPWHIGYRYNGETDEETDGRLHQMLPIDRCLILEWDDLADNYAGEDCTLRSGEVEFFWEGDFYEWKYAEPKPDKRHEISAVLNDAEMDVADFIAIRREQMRDEMTRQVGKVRNVRWTIRMEAEEA